LNGKPGREHGQRRKPPGQTVPVAPHTGPDTGHHQPNPHHRKHTWVEKIAVAFAALAFGASAWQGYVARDTESRQLRAYLGVDHIEVVCCKIIDEQRRAGFVTANSIKIFVKNSGQTPASDVRVRALYAEYPYDDPFPQNINFTAPQSSGPPGIFPFIEASFYMLAGQVRFFNSPAEPIATMRIQERLSYGVIYGHVEFTDAFNARRIVNFCRIYRITTVADDEFGECPQHNGEEPPSLAW
jgi:hypothetical protein